MDYEIDGNSAVLTASSSGLGKASAKVLAGEGVNVVINGRSEETLEEAVAEVEEVATGEVLGVQGDITRAADIERLIETAVTEFGGLDHLVTSSGGPPRHQFEETTDGDWYDAYDLLVMSVVRAVRESLPYLTESDSGTIVSITSRRTKEATPSNVLSSSVRMCVPGLMKCISREYGPQGIRYNTVRPGSHKTPRVDPDTYGRREENTPLSRVGEPREFGDVVAFLCSKRSSYLTGASIPVDGGVSHSTL